jgi:hypothetical protein
LPGSLQVPSHGARVTFSGGTRAVTDGPSSIDAKELVTGFWIIQVRSKDEAIEWAKRLPLREGAVQIAQVFAADSLDASDPRGERRR